MSLKNRHEIRKRASAKAHSQRPWPALIGDGAGTIEVPGSPGLWYVRPVGSSLPIPVYRGGAPRLNNYPVWVGKDLYNRRWVRILGTNLDGLINDPGGGGTDVEPHAPSHYLTGSDSVYISGRQVTELQLTVVSGFTIRIVSGFVVVNGQPAYVSTQNIDLTSHVPGTGARWVLVRANSSGVLSVQDGTNEASYIDVSYDNMPEIEAGYAPLWAVRLYDGQTAINASATAPDFYDLRFVSSWSLEDHDHSGTGSGGQLDWDNVWSDAVHSHASDAEGGQLDWDNVWSDAVHDHSSNAEGGTLALDNLSDVDTTGKTTGDIIYKSAGDWVDYPLGIGTKIEADDVKLRFGNIAGGDYVDVDISTGNLRLVGDATAFDDLQMQLVGQRLESPASNITYDEDEAAVVFQDDCDLTDFLTMNIQMSHAWLIGSDIFPHLHWWQASADVPNWLLQYRWQIQGAAKTTSWTNLAWDHHIFIYSAGTLNQITDFPAITPPVGAGLSDIIQFRLLRDTGNDSGEFGTGDDPLAGDATAVNFDIHYEIDSFGSDTEYAKDTTASMLLESGDYLLLESGDNLLIE